MNSISKAYVFIALLGCAIAHASLPPMEPQPGQPAQPVAAALAWKPSELVEDDGLTTTPGDDRGDWYFKRLLYRDARPITGAISETALKIDGYKKDFFAARSTIDNEIDNFYITYGFEAGEADEQIDILTRQTNTLRQKDVQLTEETRALLAELTDKKKDVEQVKTDLAAIHDLDVALDQALTTLLDQISVSHIYEQKAWENYDKISDVLSDEIAERLFLEIQGYKINVDAVDNYIRGPFAQYFEQSIKAIKEQMEKVKKRVEDLKQRGVLLEKKVFEDPATIEARQKQQELDNQQKLAQERAANRRWWTPIIEFPGTVVGFIGDTLSGFWNFVTSLFVSEPAKLKVHKARSIEPEVQQEPVTPEQVPAPATAEPAVTIPEPPAPVAPAPAPEATAPEQPAVLAEITPAAAVSALDIPELPVVPTQTVQEPIISAPEVTVPEPTTSPAITAPAIPEPTQEAQVPVVAAPTLPTSELPAPVISAPAVTIPEPQAGPVPEAPAAAGELVPEAQVVPVTS